VHRSKNGWSCPSTLPIRLHGVVLRGSTEFFSRGFTTHEDLGIKTHPPPSFRPILSECFASVYDISKYRAVLRAKLFLSRSCEPVAVMERCRTPGPLFLKMNHTRCSYRRLLLFEEGGRCGYSSLYSLQYNRPGDEGGENRCGNKTSCRKCEIR
jgi:hypothetical protein